jgi:signal transduction histidine kinase
VSTTQSPSRLPLALPRIARAERGRALAGVCSGIASSLGVDPTLVRLAFALLAFAGGAGVVAYGGAWLFLPAEGEPDPGPRRRLLGGVMLAVAGALALRGLGLSDALVWPAVLCGAGVVLMRRAGAASAAAVVLIGAGVVVFVASSPEDGQDTLLDPSAVAIAFLLVVGPWAWRLAAERDAERTARIRSQERAEMAARVHDSVLQTMALVQREARDPRRVASLARRQERELRSWLYPDSTAAGAGSLSAALDAAAAEVEELHGVIVELVRTGDTPLDDRVQAVVLAAREAMANAARHSGADEVSTFLEVDDDEIAVYVRDRGRGFDPATLPADAHGIAESIRGRMARAGGIGQVTSVPGGGTEVELRLRRRP